MLIVLHTMGCLLRCCCTGGNCCSTVGLAIMQRTFSDKPSTIFAALGAMLAIGSNKSAHSASAVVADPGFKLFLLDVCALVHLCNPR